jgi:HNH/ENDO VII superfamily nuclease
MTGSGSGFKITPSELRSSGSTMQNFGDRVAAGGDKLQAIGSRLTAHAGRDKSGVGAVIAKALGRGTEVAGKVFKEGGRVAGAAGKRLHSNASAHETNESNVTNSFHNITDPKTNTRSLNSGGGGGGGRRYGLRPQDDGRRHSGRFNPYARPRPDEAPGSTPTPRPQYAPPRQHGMWNEQTRPQWNPETKPAVLGNMEQTQDGKYICQGPCGRPLSADEVTLDHKQDWKSYTYLHAGDAEGITSQDAKTAYNDVSNLQGLCQPCNSSKNGPRNQFA